MFKKLFERLPDKTTADETLKLYLTEFGKKRIGSILRKLPPKTDLSEITGVSLSTQAYYNYVNYNKPLSRKGVEACEALDKYATSQEEGMKDMDLKTAIKYIKSLGGKVTF